ncbi:hypothetical protein ACWE42_12070 [Sutcliffiella cohnii]
MNKSRHAIDEKVNKELEKYDEDVQKVISSGLRHAQRGQVTRVAERLYREIERMAKEK